MYQHQVEQPAFQGDVHLTDDDVQRWAGMIGASRSELYDQIALHLALAFNESTLTFEFCDAVMNGIHGIITNADELRPELFWKVYLAFEEGEYYHGNNREEDPVERYTRPMISQVLRELASR